MEKIRLDIINLEALARCLQFLLYFFSLLLSVHCLITGKDIPLQDIAV
jgi:hypothetical protein